MNEPLLVFDSHEAWVYQLSKFPCAMDVVVGLRGRHTSDWDHKMRPVPRNARLVRLDEAFRNGRRYSCVVCHNLTDLLDSKTLDCPRILVIHETLDGALREQSSSLSSEQLRVAVARYVDVTGTHVVSVSRLKGRSWGFEDDIVPLSADPAEYLPYRGDWPCGLRVANHIQRRPHILLWDLHQKAFDGLPVNLVGHNPDMPGVRSSENWQELKEIFRRHRFYIHTADPNLEDGYNMATLEAMAAGLPVLGNPHPTSPVRHGVSGFLSNNPKELRQYAIRLLIDQELAARMGKAAQETVTRDFSVARFSQNFARSLEFARCSWERRTAVLSA